MSQTLPEGPYDILDVGDGARTPWYIIPFDKKGRPTGPKTRANLIASARQDFTHIFIFAHGWNNDWKAASERYKDFLNGYIEMRKHYHLEYCQPHRSLLVGIFWPSASLVFPWERQPKIAAGQTPDDARVAEAQSEILELADDVPEELKGEFYDLAQSASLSETQALQFARILHRSFQTYSDPDEGPQDGVASPEQLTALWRAMPDSDKPSAEIGQFRFARDTAGLPEAAFAVGDLDPRNILRLATVLQMKDRAAKVGAHGVGPLLRDLLKANPSAQIHLLGHSYGCVVLLSALCYPRDEAIPPQVESALLLQPAVSQWCFAADVYGKGFAGGYRRALQQVRQPILTTFTKHDLPLTKVFHLAVRRSKDLGQPVIAATGLPSAPSKYAALGGYGPAGLTAVELEVLPMEDPTTPYVFETPGARVCALNADEKIAGHGDISNAAAWWTLYVQVEGKGFRAKIASSS